MAYKIPPRVKIISRLIKLTSFNILDLRIALKEILPKRYIPSFQGKIINMGMWERMLLKIEEKRM